MTQTPHSPASLDRGAALMAALEAFDEELIQAIEAAHASSREIESVTPQGQSIKSDINQT